MTTRLRPGIGTKTLERPDSPLLPSGTMPGQCPLYPPGLSVLSLFLGSLHMMDTIDNLRYHLR